MASIVTDEWRSLKMLHLPPPDVSRAVRRTLPSLFAACLSFAYFTGAHGAIIGTSQAEVLDYPYADTELVSVKDIGPNWVHIEAHVVLGAYDLETGGRPPVAPGFLPDNQSHLNQVSILGDYVCRLNDKRGIVLSQVVEQEPYKLYYLVACATP